MRNGHTSTERRTDMRMTKEEYEKLMAGRNTPAKPTSVSPSTQYANLPPAKGMQPARKMNGLEKSYMERLDGMKHAGQILWYAYESVNLRIGANKCFYAPDFMVMMADGTIEMHETKGHWEDDALVKIKVAAGMFPFKFRAFQKIKGQWVERSFG